MRRATATVPRVRPRAITHALALVSSLLVILAAAVTLSWPAPEPTAPPNTADDREMYMQVREIASMLRAPCCPNLTVSQHNSPVTMKMKREIGEMIRQGMTQSAIIAEMKVRYGEAIAPAVIPALWKPYLFVGGPILGLGLLALLGRWILAHERKPTVLHIEGPVAGGEAKRAKAA